MSQQLEEEERQRAQSSVLEKETEKEPVQGKDTDKETIVDNTKDKPYSVVPLGPKPQIVSCPHCGYYVTTEVNIIPSAKTHFKAIIMCICCLCFIPYICPICMNVDHFCPECENYIGTYIN